MLAARLVGRPASYLIQHEPLGHGLLAIQGFNAGSCAIGLAIEFWFRLPSSLCRLMIGIACMTHHVFIQMKS